MPTINYGSTLTVLSFVDAIGTPLVFGLLVFFLGLLALSRRDSRSGSAKRRVSHDVLGGLFFVFVLPVGVISGAAHYIVVANTGYYGTPDDFRNSATFVNICWLFIVAVAPAFALIGFVVLGSIPFGRWRAHRGGRPAQTSPRASVDESRGNRRHDSRSLPR